MFQFIEAYRIRESIWILQNLNHADFIKVKQTKKAVCRLFRYL